MKKITTRDDAIKCLKKEQAREDKYFVEHFIIKPCHPKPFESIKNKEKRAAVILRIARLSIEDISIALKRNPKTVRRWILDNKNAVRQCKRFSMSTL